ncbi:MAG TPA: histidine phosphatase family protein [Chloroflexota bacterium]|nr:histidine phosphatase family protein [Chloroflexota bacterium]
MATNTLYLVRHGENLANVTREFSYKKVDYDLTEKGVRQAELTARYFAAMHAERPIDAIFTSPLKRAVQTAEIVGAATGHPVAVIEELREINCGDFDGVPPTEEMWAHHDQILRSWRNGEHDVRFPGGEDFHELRARARSALGQAVAGRDGKTIVLVAHGGIVGAALSDICPDLDHELVWRVPNRNCAVTELELHSNGADIASAWGILKRWANCEHLDA